MSTKSYTLLDSNCPKALQPERLSIPLKPHQLTLLQYAKKLESNDGILVNAEEWNETAQYSYRYVYPSDLGVGMDTRIYTRRGVICDKVGAGKSFVILSLIADQPRIVMKRPITKTFSSKSHIRGFCDTNDITFKTNLLIVPHNIFNQWKQYIVKHTNLSTMFFQRKSDFEKYKTFDDFKTIFDQIELILISATMFRAFADNYVESLYDQIKQLNKRPLCLFSRIIFDEVHTINIPSCPSLPSNFNWFISSSMNDMYSIRNCGFLHDEMHDISGDIVKCIYVIKNADKFIDESINIPNLIEEIILCKPNQTVSLINDFISNKLKQMLFAGDTDGVVNALKIKVCNTKNIIDNVCENIKKELHNEQLRLAFKNTIQYSSDIQKVESIKKTEDKIKGLWKKIEMIEDRIKSSNIDPISYDEIENPVIVPCCKNKFDLTSLTSYFTYSQKSECPLCRQHFDMSNLLYVKDIDTTSNSSDESENVKEYNTVEHSKQENLEWLLETKISKDSSILIFSEYECNLQQLKTIYTNVGRGELIPITGSSTSITKIIDDFKSKKNKSLYLNATYSGAGLNIETADVVILMHKMTTDQESQVIGRAHRLGRINPLRVYKLYGQNENY